MQCTISNDPYSKKWNMIILMFIIECIQFLGYSGYSTQAETMMTQLGLGYSQFSALASSCTLTIGICILFVGILVDYWSAKKLTTIGLLVMAVSQVLFGMAQSYPAMILARVIGGIGIAAVVSAPYSLSEKWFAKSESSGLSYAIMLSADGVGGLLALYAFAILMSVIGWRMGAYLSAALYVVLFFLSLFFLKDYPDHEADKAELKRTDPNPFAGFFKIITNRNVIGAAAVVIGHTGAYAVATFWIPTILQEGAGWSASVSGLLANMYPVVAIPFMIALPTMTKHVRRVKPIMLLFGVIAVIVFFCCALAVHNSAYVMLAVLLTVLGVFNYMNSSMAFGVAAESIGVKKAGIATAIIQFFAFAVGGAVFPTLIGIVRDRTNSYETGFIIMAFCLVVLMVFVPMMIKEND